MSLAQQLIAAEMSSRKGEQDVFRRLQERVDEVEQLKQEKAALIARHQEELSGVQAQMSDTLTQLEEHSQHQISLKDSSISELRDVVSQLTSDPGMVVDEIRRAYVCGVRSPEKLRPPRLTEPAFRSPSKMPELIQNAILGKFNYEKLHKVVKAADAALPGDQMILRCIQTMSKDVLAALQDTDSPETEGACIARVRALLKRVLDAREKCAWGDYVRPSQQHIEGPDISAYSIIDIERSLSKQESRELELLAKQQDMMNDPMALKSLMEQLAVDCQKQLAALDAQKQEVDDVHVASFQSYQAAVNQIMHSIRTSKTARIRDEFEAGIRSKESTLVKQKGELADVLSRITLTLKDINELKVCKGELEASLASDEESCAAVNKEIEGKLHKLEMYKYTLEKRAIAMNAVGKMEQDILTHIQELLLERGKDLFEGKASMLMRQFEVLPNVYCQCAIFEDL